MLSALTLAVRSWGKTPRLAFTLIGCIALSIAGAATVLTFVHSLLLRPLPFPAADRLVVVNPHAEGTLNQATRPYFSYPDFADLRERNTNFELFEGATVSRLIVQTSGGAERLRGETVTRGYFTLFGVQPQFGRLFSADEYAGRGERVIILSDRIWRTRFAANPQLVGKSISTRSGPMIVAGVLPKSFLGVGESDGTDYWIAEMQNLHPAMVTDRDYPTTLIFGRLKVDTNAISAESELRTLLAALPAPAATTARTLTARVAGFGEQWREGLRGGLVTMLLGSFFLLAIGCANVALLLLARLVGRERELAVRLALGATRGDLLRQMLAESLVLAAAGGAAGVLASTWLIDAFVRLAGVELPLQLPVVLSPAPIIFCAALVVVTGLVFGLLPALVALRVDSATALRTGGRGFAAGALQGRGGKLLVIGQTALAVLLLSGAALFLRSYDRLRHADFGFRTENLLRYQISPQRENYATPDAIATYWRNTELELRAVPGVRHTGFMAPTLPPYDASDADVRLKGGDFGAAGGALRVNQHFTNNALFEILRVPLREGRWFGAQDRRGGQAVGLVSESLARRIAPAGSALGRTLLWNNAEVVIVGVVADARWNGQRNRAPSGFNLFLSLEQFPQLSVGVLFDASVWASTLIDPVRKAVFARDANVALHWIDTMEEALDYQTVREKFWAVLAAAYGVTAFLLAAFGLYGVLSHGVASRTREIGVRLALGATARGIMRLVVRQGLTLVLAGLVCGLGLALVAGRLIEAKLHGISTRDPVALLVVAALLLIVATGACLLPARRAAKTDPMEALRAE